MPSIYISQTTKERLSKFTKKARVYTPNDAVSFLLDLAEPYSIECLFAVIQTPSVTGEMKEEEFLDESAKKMKVAMKFLEEESK